MLSSDSIVKLASALVKAQAEFKPVQKGGENKFDNYSYAKLEDYVHAVRPILKAHGLSILTSVDEVTPLEDRQTANGKKEHAVRVKVGVRIIHESGEWLEASAWGEGQDRSDKAVYKAITGARKYGVASALGLATTDDPEAEEGDSSAAGRAAAKPDGNTGGDVLANDKVFKEQLAKTFKSRSFKTEEMKTAVGAALNKYGADKVEELKLDQRHALLISIAKGEADKFKGQSQSNGKAAIANA